jgi:hypothetical protein
MVDHDMIFSFVNSERPARLDLDVRGCGFGRCWRSNDASAGVADPSRLASRPTNIGRQDDENSWHLFGFTALLSVMTSSHRLPVLDRSNFTIEAVYEQMLIEAMEFPYGIHTGYRNI